MDVFPIIIQNPEEIYAVTYDYFCFNITSDTNGDIIVTGVSNVVDNSRVSSDDQQFCPNGIDPDIYSGGYV